VQNCKSSGFYSGKNKGCASSCFDPVMLMLVQFVLQEVRLLQRDRHALYHWIFC